MAEVGYTQNARVTINKRKATLKEVLNEIERQTDYLFIYNNEVNTNEKVSVRAKQKAVSEVLNFLLEDRDMDYSMEGNHIILSMIKESISMEKEKVINANQQQKKQITGIVVDADGTPIIGANIVETGTSNGTITDIDGNFVLNVEERAIIHISYIGYLDQDINTSGQNFFKVTLFEDTQTLEELVVIGYGTMPKRSISTAISSVNADNIKQMPVGTVGEALYGQLPGLYIVQNNAQPGNAPTLRIRGTGSLTASSDPLFVIDGYPTNDASYFMDILPEDIETINILKDAASSAIYGSRAGNGVILVTTKRGKTERKDIAFNATLGLQQPQRYIDVLSAPEFALMIKDARENQGMAPLPILDDPSQWVVTDWQKDVFFRTAPIQKYDLSIRGASNKAKYNMSAIYENQQGIVQNSFNHKLGLRANVELELNNYLTTGISIQPTYTYQRVQQTSGGNTTVTAGTIAEAVAYPPIFGPYADNGDYFQIQQHTKNTDFNSELTNPLSKLLEINNDYNRIRTLTQAFVNIKPVKNLNIRSDINAALTNQKNEYYRSAFSPGSSRQGNKSTPNLAAIDAYRSASFAYNVYWSTTATYNYVLNDAHSISAMAGYDLAYNSAYSVRQDDRTDSNYPIAYGNTNIENVSGAFLWNGSSSNAEYAFDAMFGRINYDYKSKYIFSGSVRRDRSSKFGPKNRAGVFWSLSGAYNISEESWLKNINWLSVAKIRASYGVTGNDQLGSNYVWTSTLATDYYVFGSGSNSIRTTGYYPNSYANLALGWEKNTQFDAGLDLGLFNRISFSLDYYKRISDAVLAASIPNLNGRSGSVTINAGKIQNRGVEISLGAPILTGDFKWKSDFNISFNRNKLLSLATGNDYYGTVNGMVRNYVGRPLGDIYTYVNIGTFNSAEEVANDAKYLTQSIGDLKFLDYVKDGRINSDDMVYQGNNMPKFNAGWINQFSYKNIDLSFVLDGQYGGLIYWGFGYASGLNRHMENAFSIYAKNRWRSENEIGDGISQKAGSSNVTGALASQTRYLFKSDYLKIRNIAIGYTVPNRITKKIGVNKLRFNINIQNLYSFDEYPGYSVEAGGMGGATGGSDGGNYPTVRTFTFGMNINL
jgi:TonB-linked SusC/RagA family outer membrane protein